jgi:sec-independent protein translocase protein TatA
VSIGPLEIVIVLVLALLVFGPKRLPQAGRSLGHTIREFRKATQSARSELGLDEVAESVNDLKSSMKIDLNSVTAPAPRDDAAAAAAAVVVAPPADEPVREAAAATDITPVDVPAMEATEPAADTPPMTTAVVEPAADDVKAGADTASGGDAIVTGASVGHDDA